MVSVFGALAVWSALSFAAETAGAPAPAPAPLAVAFEPALKGQSFPWYDADTGRVKPVLPWEFRPAWLERVGRWATRVWNRVTGWFRWLNRFRLPFIGSIAGMGDVLMIGLAMMLLTLVVVGLLELLRRYRPTADDDAAKAATIRAGSALRIEGLPAGVRFDASDPWAEAQRLRARGDLSGAVVYLFAHQLLSLGRLNQLRLVPGRTGRQLVRAVGDRRLRGLVEPTLWLFEAVYYGHRAPTAEAFESVWASALEFQSRLSTEGVT